MAASTKTGLMYDLEMTKHRIPSGDHPERPERLTHIVQRLERRGLAQRCVKLDARMVKDDELLLVHSQEHVDTVMSYGTMSNRERARAAHALDSIYLNPSTPHCARMSAGCAVQTVDAVLDGNVANAAAVIRPPGHHAECEAPRGFCFFNNAAIAAKHAITNKGIKRVLILDWDVHHGNGTQNMFYDDDRVLFISLHKYRGMMFYPGAPDAEPSYVGKDAGRGFNVNVAWTAIEDTGDIEYINAFNRIVMPIAHEFAPELVIISAGFDAARGDPLGGFDVTPAGYAHMTHMLRSLAGGRVVALLEGGYNLDSIAKSMCAVVSTMLNDPLPPLVYDRPIFTQNLQDINNVIKEHAKFWNNLVPIDLDAWEKLEAARLEEKQLQATVPVPESPVEGQETLGSDDSVNKELVVPVTPESGDGATVTGKKPPSEESLAVQRALNIDSTAQQGDQAAVEASDDASDTSFSSLQDVLSTAMSSMNIASVEAQPAAAEEEEKGNSLN